MYDEDCEMCYQDAEGFNVTCYECCQEEESFYEEFYHDIHKALIEFRDKISEPSFSGKNSYATDEDFEFELLQMVLPSHHEKVKKLRAK